MRFLEINAVLLGGLGLLAGCGNNDGLSAAMVGSYAREAGSERLRLDLTPTGLTITGPAAGASPGATAPVPGGAKLGLTGSALFEKVTCTDEASCRFNTKSGCEGTFTRDGSGAVVIVAVGDCEAWSGKWSPDKGGEAPSASATTSSAPSASASAGPAASSPVPAAQPQPTVSATAVPTASATATASATPTTSASASPTALNVSCLAKCNDTSMACIRQCKIGEMDCMKTCSTQMSDCAQKCP